MPLEFLGKLDVITLLAIAGMFWVFNGRLDKKFEKIDSKFNEFKNDLKQIQIDLDKRIDDQSKRIDELSAKIDRNDAKLDAKIDLLEKDFIQMNTKIAVIESRLSDISTNVTHLMWHSQSLPQPKEEANEG